MPKGGRGGFPSRGDFRDGRRPCDPRHDLGLGTPAVVEAEAAANLLEPEARQSGEDVAQSRLARAAQGVDEEAALTPVGDLEVEGVEGVEELVALELFEDVRPRRVAATSRSAR